ETKLPTRSNEPVPPTQSNEPVPPTRSNEPVPAKRSNEPVPFTKNKITLFKSEYEHFRKWPWVVKTPESSFIVQAKLKEIINDYNVEYTRKDNPILLSIVDTAYPEDWIRIKFAQNEWDQMSDTSECFINKAVKETINADKTWQANVITFTLERRRILISSDEEPTEGTVHGYQSTEKFLVYEISKSPSNQSGEKSISDRYKLYKTMKDNYDTIVSYFYNQFGEYMYQNHSLRNLEIYGILVSGFELEIFVLDQPGAVVSRVRRITRIEIPVNIKNNDYYLWIDRLVYALNTQHSLLNKLISKLKREKLRDEEYKGFLFSTIPKSIGSP
ncbi:16461_t:CDS:2, partial [Racocetra fulgida]